MAEYLTSFIKGRAPLALRAHCISTARENRNKLRQIWHKPYTRSDDGSHCSKNYPLTMQTNHRFFATFSRSCCTKE